jgi:hypothetical protein
MALVSKLEQIQLDRNSVHESVSATFCIFTDSKGNRFLQIDTYGSNHREIPGKKSQSIQFGPEGLTELRAVLAKL